MTHTLLDKSLRGVKWTSLSTIINMVSQVFLMAIMARLLEPAAFGLAAMAMVALRFASYFAQLGIGPAIVQKPVLEAVDIRVAWMLAIVLGCVASGAVYLVAPFVGQAMKNDQLAMVIRVLTLSFVLNGLSTVSTNLLRRQLRFKALAFVESISYLLGYGACGILLALGGAGVWSLVGASLCQGLVTCILGYALTRHPVLPRFDRQATRHFVGYGSRYSVIGFLEFIGSNLDTLAIGRFLGEAATGLYNRAFLLTNLPVQNVVNSLTKVMFPVLSEAQHDRNKIEQAYLLFLFLVGSLTGAVCLGMIPAANDLVLTLLGDKWGASVPVLQVLAVSVPFVFLSHIVGIILDALGVLRPKIRIQSASIVVLVLMMYVLSGMKLIGFAAAVVIAEIFKLVAYFVVMKSLFQPSNRILSKILFYVVSISAVTATMIWLATKMPILGDWPHWGRLAVEIIVGAGSLFVLFLMAWSGLGQLHMHKRINDRFPVLLQLSSSVRFF